MITASSTARPHTYPRTLPHPSLQSPWCPSSNSVLLTSYLKSWLLTPLFYLNSGPVVFLERCDCMGVLGVLHCPPLILPLFRQKCVLNLFSVLSKVKRTSVFLLYRLGQARGIFGEPRRASKFTHAQCWIQCDQEN